MAGTKTAEAATYYWVTWNTYSLNAGTHTLTGTITTAGDTVAVTYTNTQGLAGYQLGDGTGGNTNYYSGGTDGAAGTSPYTSATVENRPNNVTIVRLSNAGAQTLTFDKQISNLALAFVSLNGTAFSFDRNFDVLSFGNATDGGNACGFWGCGTAAKTIGVGAYPYIVSGTGEPHGTLHFSGAFNAITWTSGNENWHGFTVGIAGTAAEVAADTTPPTVTFNPANGAVNVPLASTVTITFNEEVRNLNDTPLTSANVDALITLKDTDAAGADIPFDAVIDADNKVITITPAGNFTLGQIIYVAIGATVEDTFGNAIAASSAIFTTGASLPSCPSGHEDPRNNKDVIGSIRAWSDMSDRWAKSNLDTIDRRMDILRMEKNSYGSEMSGVSSGDPVRIPWSLWTRNEVTTGRVDATEFASEQDFKDFKFFGGMDRPLGEDGVLGFSLGVGKSKTDVGSSGTLVKADNYSISGYTSFKLLDSLDMESSLGYGHLPITTRRTDGDQSLSGSRRAHQAFGSASLKTELLRGGKFQAAPFGRVEGSWTALDGFAETGGSQALMFDRQYYNTTSILTGVDAVYDVRVGGILLRPSIRTAFGAKTIHESEVNLRYVLGPANYEYTLAGQTLAYWRVEGGLDFKLNERISIFLNYSWERTEDSDHLNNFGLQTAVAF